MIDDVHPRTPAGFPAKAVGGRARAGVGPADRRRARPARRAGAVAAQGRPQAGNRRRCGPGGDDRWTGSISPAAIGLHELVVDAWTDRYATWRHEIEVKAAAGQDVELELEEGARILEDLAAEVAGAKATEAPASRRRGRAPRRAARSRCGWRRPSPTRSRTLVDGVPDARLSSSAPQPLWVDRPRAGHAAWYELFPRSFGGLKGAIEHLSYVADLGFDVVYLPPIHPIGTTHRKGRGNSLVRRSRRPGQPVGHRWPRRRPRRGRTPSSAPSTTSTPSSTPPRTSASRWRSTTRSSAARTTPGSAITRSGSSAARTARSATPRTRPRSTRTSTRSSSGRADDADRVRAVGGVPRRARALDRPRRPHVPGRQPAHQAAGVLGVGDRRRARPSPRRPLPRRGVHRAGDDGQARRGRLHARATPTSPGATSRGSCASTSTSSPTPPLVEYMRPSFWPNTPDILDDHLRHAPPARSRCGSSWPRRSCRSTASTPATSSARTSPPTTPPRSTGTPRSTSSRRATTSRSRRSRR